MGLLRTTPHLLIENPQKIAGDPLIEHALCKSAPTPGLTRDGYGQVTVNGVREYAHRAAYVEAHGEIPEGLEIDHLCRNRWCCEWTHLEAVTRSVNQRRGVGAAGANARKTHCPQGHEYTEKNTYPSKQGRARQCRECNRIRSAAFRARKVAAVD